MAHKSYGSLLWYFNSALDVSKLKNFKFLKGLISINTAWNRATIRVFRIKKKNDIYNYNKKIEASFFFETARIFLAFATKNRCARTGKWIEEHECEYNTKQPNIYSSQLH